MNAHVDQRWLLPLMSAYPSLVPVWARPKPTPSRDWLEMKPLERPDLIKASVSEIIAETARHFKVRKSDMFSNRRTADIAYPRHVARYIASEFTSKSLPQLGKLFGGKDHTTILNSRGRIRDLVNRGDEKTIEAISAIRTKLEEGARG
jgi:chromosomal replication initiation ATPase DnaA